MRALFIGPPAHWFLLAAVLVIMYLLGTWRIHTQFFNPFSLILLTLVIAVYCALMLTAERGSRITRIPLDEER